MAFNRPPFGPKIYSIQSDFDHNKPIRIGLRTVLSDYTTRHPARDSVDIHEVDKAIQLARGETRLFFSGASARFIHGPDTLIPMMAIAQELLSSGEKLLAVHEARFRKLVRTELALEARPADQVSPQEISEAAALLKVRTNQNRVLTIIGKPTTKLIAGGIWPGRMRTLYSFFDNRMEETITADTVQRRYFMRQAPAMNGHDMFSPAVQLATFFDIALQAGGNILDEYMRQDLLLAASAKKMTIPNLNELEDGAKLTAILQDPLRTGKRFSFGVITITLTNPNGTQLASATIEIATPNSTEVEQAFYREQELYPNSRQAW